MGSDSRIGRLLRSEWFTLAIMAGAVAGLILPTALGDIIFRFSSWAAAFAIFCTGLKFDVRKLHFRRSFLGGILLSTALSVVAAPPLFHFSAGWIYDDNPAYYVGLILLSLLPTTIVSHIALADTAKGNTALSSLATVSINLVSLITIPLFARIFLGEATAVNAWSLFVKVLLIVVLPNVLAQLVHLLPPALPLAPTKKVLSKIPQIVVVLFIFVGVNLNQGTLRAVSTDPQLLLILLVPALALHLLLMGLAWAGSRLLRLDRGDLIAVLFAASQKTITIGVALVSTAFPEAKEGTLLLVVYHVLSLVLDSFIAGALRKKAPAP